MKTFDFQKQLLLGTRGEELFLENYHSPLVIQPKHAYDFIRVTDGAKIELKTDSYNMDKTPNFFWERYSDWDTKSPGGVWQSRAHRVDIFIYYFARHNTYFEFDLKILLKFLNTKADKVDMLFVKNKTWVTAGFLVPREELKHLYTQYTFVPKETKNA